MKIFMVLLLAMIVSSCFPSTSMYWELRQPQSHVQDAQFLATRILDRFDFLSVYSTSGSSDNEIHLSGYHDDFGVSLKVERGLVTVEDRFFAGTKGQKSGLQSRRTPDEFKQFVETLRSLMQDNGAIVVISNPKYAWGFYL